MHKVKTSKLSFQDAWVCVTPNINSLDTEEVKYLDCHAFPVRVVLNNRSRMAEIRFHTLREPLYYLFLRLVR